MLQIDAEAGDVVLETVGSQAGHWWCPLWIYTLRYFILLWDVFPKLFIDSSSNLFLVQTK